MRVGIALGSNLGERHALLQSAMEQLRRLHEGGDFLVSSFYETEPVDCPPDSPVFVNAVLELETSLTPRELLNHLQEMERQAGRPSLYGFHTPRTLDLDILYYGDQVLNSDQLQIPHPRIRERLFVLQPLAEIRPYLRLSGWDKSCIEYLLHINK